MPETQIISRSSHKLINIITIAVLAVLCGAKPMARQNKIGWQNFWICPMVFPPMTPLGEYLAK
ncbi:hypothetical protein [Microcoleus sp.]|uniref:hypothetical protein n=1 Tax=Microcoleus sp. TaxID=44472 RepID=UPI0035948285